MGGRSEVCISLKPEPFYTRRKEKEIPVCRRGAALNFVEFPGPPLGLGPGYCLKLVMEGLPLRRGGTMVYGHER